VYGRSGWIQIGADILPRLCFWGLTFLFALSNHLQELPFTLSLQSAVYNQIALFLANKSAPKIKIWAEKNHLSKAAFSD
jgi:hypothetical protein